jgi:hypothetical protein
MQPENNESRIMIIELSLSTRTSLDWVQALSVVTILLCLEMIPDHDFVIMHASSFIQSTASTSHQKTVKRKNSNIRHPMSAKCGGNERDGYHFTYLIKLYFSNDCFKRILCPCIPQQESQILLLS